MEEASTGTIAEGRVGTCEEDELVPGGINRPRGHRHKGVACQPADLEPLPQAVKTPSTSDARGMRCGAFRGGTTALEDPAKASYLRFVIGT